MPARGPIDVPVFRQESRLHHAKEVLPPAADELLDVYHACDDFSSVLDCSFLGAVIQQ
jgi:hypothetical protein